MNHMQLSELMQKAELTAQQAGAMVGVSTRRIQQCLTGKPDSKGRPQLLGEAASRLLLILLTQSARDALPPPVIKEATTAEKIDAVIKEHGSLRAAARALGVNHGDLSRAKNGKAKPSARLLKALEVRT